MKYPKYLLAFTVCNVVLAGSAATPYVIGSQDTTGQRSPMAEEVFKNANLEGHSRRSVHEHDGFFFRIARVELHRLSRRGKCQQLDAIRRR